MLGRYQVGTRWLGSGRSQNRDYVQVQSDLSARARMEGREFRAAKSFRAAWTGLSRMVGDSSVVRGFLMRVSAVARMAGETRRIRGLFTSWTAAAVGTFRTSAIRTMIAKWSAKSDMRGLIGRIREFFASWAARARFQGVSHRTRQFLAAWQANARALARPIRERKFLAGWQARASMSVRAGVARVLRAAWTGTATWLFGFITDRFSPGRVIVYVPPKLRDAVIPPKRRTIVYTGDDRGLNMEEFVKQPSEIVDYMLDMRDWFRPIRDDFITDVDITVDITGDPDDLDIGPPGLPIWVPVGDPSHQAKIWIGGGRDGVTYKVTAVVTTNRGRVEEVDFLLSIEDQ